MKSLKDTINESLQKGENIFPEIDYRDFYTSIEKPVKAKSKLTGMKKPTFSQMDWFTTSNTDEAKIRSLINDGYLIVRYSPFEDSLNDTYVDVADKDDVKLAIKLIQKKYKVKFIKDVMGRPHSSRDGSLTTIDSYLLFK